MNYFATNTISCKILLLGEDKLYISCLLATSEIEHGTFRYNDLTYLNRIILKIALSGRKPNWYRIYPWAEKLL